MDRKEAVRELLSRGEMPTPELIEGMVSGKNVSHEKTKESGKEDGDRRVEVRILSPERKERLSSGDFTSYYNNKYDGLREILSSKINAISINRARETFGEVGVIGMIREKTPTGYMIEDTTGSIELVHKGSNVVPGDVIGVSGQVRENRLFGKGLVFPDVPLTQKYSPIKDIRITLSRKPPKRKEEGTLYFHVERKDGRLPNGSSIEISSRGKARILFYSPLGKAGPQECMESLKKRHLNISHKEIISPRDDFIIKEVPDVLWTDSDTRFVESYKGVLIVSPGSEEASIDLETKKVC
jgi:DNA polymerase II small subunit/DNA polymerase delta subunit B